MNFLIVLCVFLSMEGVTWCIHKYVMHGFLWVLHKDHHDHSSKGNMEKNDYFFFIFAMPAIILMYFGALNGFNFLFYIGIGITLYGIAYFLVHDIFIHQRLRFFRNANSPYFKAIRRGHKQHHKHLVKEEGECFGFLFVPLKYSRMYFKQKNE